MFTCKTNKDACESRIDFILANDRLTPAVTSCYVDSNSDYPTHRPLIIEIVTKLLENASRELRKPTNFARMLNKRLKKKWTRLMISVRLKELVKREL